MNLETLDLFCDVARRGRFAAVAGDRGVDPSSISRAIALMERELGVRLFYRTTRSMRLTEAGERFHRHAQAILSRWDQAQDSLHTDAQTPQGQVRVTCSVAYAERVLMPLLHALQTAYPGLTIDLLATDAPIDLVQQGIDIALRHGPDIDGDVIRRRLHPTTYHVVAGGELARDLGRLGHPGDLTTHPCLRYSQAPLRSQWRFQRRDALGEPPFDIPVTGRLSSASPLALRAAARNGQGIALLANWLIADDLESGRLTDLLPAYQATPSDFGTAVWLVYADRTYHPTRVRTVIDFLVERLFRP